MDTFQRGLDYQTPIDVARYMASLVPIECVTVLEPTPGLGNLVMALKERSFFVIAPDDYFLFQKQKVDAVVMNPPFSAKYAVLDNAKADYSKYGMRLGYMLLQEATEMADTVICLMPWFTISDSDVRLRSLKEFGLVSVTALPRKTFKYARVQTCILHLQKGFKGKTEFKVYDLLINQ